MAKSFMQVLSNAASSPPRAALGDWFGKTIKLSDGGFWSQFLGLQSSSGQMVTVDKAMQLSAVWACVRLLSETIATLPLGLYRTLPDGSREVAKDASLYTVVHTRPNANMTAMQFWEAVAASMMLRGNAFCEVHRSAGRIIAVDFLLPTRVTVDLNDDGSLKYTYTPRSGGQRVISPDNMMHIPAFSLDGLIGLSPIAYGANVFGSAMSADNAANGTFKNGMMPTVAFKVDRTLKPEQREDFRKYVETVSGAMNAGRSPVLEQGVTPETIGINPTDAQLLESRGYSVEEICRWFRIPPWMVGHTEKTTSWGTGIEQQMIGFLTFALQPWLVRIEQAISKSLLTPAERTSMYAEYSIEGLLRADSSARAAFYSQMVQNGIMTRDDCRVKENLSRRGGNADVLTVQTNLSPIDQLGAQPAEVQARNALMSWLNSEAK